MPADKPIVVGLKGHVASGKTMAINCLVGEEILPASGHEISPIPTGVPTIIRHNASGDGLYKCKVQYISSKDAREILSGVVCCKDRDTELDHWLKYKKFHKIWPNIKLDEQANHEELLEDARMRIKLDRKDSFTCQSAQSFMETVGKYYGVSHPSSLWLLVERLEVEVPSRFLKHGILLVDFPSRYKDFRFWQNSQNFVLDSMVLISKASRGSFTRFDECLTESEIEDMNPQTIIYALTHCEELLMEGMALARRLSIEGAVEEIQTRFPGFLPNIHEMIGWIRFLQDKQVTLRDDISGELKAVEMFFQYHASKDLPELVVEELRFTVPCKPLSTHGWADVWQILHDEAQAAFESYHDAMARFVGLTSQIHNIRGRISSQDRQILEMLREREFREYADQVRTLNLKTKSSRPPTVVDLSSRRYLKLKENPPMQESSTLSGTSIPPLRKKNLEIATGCRAEKFKSFV